MASTGDSSSPDRPHPAEDMPHSDADASSTPQFPQSAHAYSTLFAIIAHLEFNMTRLELMRILRGGLHTLVEESRRSHVQLQIVDSPIHQLVEQIRQGIEQNIDVIDMYIQLGTEHCELLAAHRQLLAAYRQVTSRSQVTPGDGDDGLKPSNGEVDGGEPAGHGKIGIAKEGDSGT